jgi:long-chain fatty acid transport protein
MRKPTRILLFAALFLVLATPTVQASGFSIFEQSAKASGMAGAYVALADDAAAAWYNPAALLWLEGSQLQFGINAISAGNDATFTIPTTPGLGIFEDTSFDAVGSVETPVHLYYSHKINEGWAWGIAVTTPFGLVSEWEDRPVTFAATKSELVTVVVNPNVAVRIGEGWSLAVGIDYMYADLKAFGREVPIDLDGNPLNGFEIIGHTDLTGTADDWSWNIALHHNGPVRFGLVYRDGFSPEASDATLAFDDFGILDPLFPDLAASATLPLPAQAQVGVGWNLNPKWFMELDVAWAGWSDFESLDIAVEGGDDIFIEENWDDTFSYRIGLTYTSSPSNQWRFGAVYDESPVPVEYLRPSIPDSARTGLTAGWGHTGEKWLFDLYVMPLWFDKVTAVPGNEGVLPGTYDVFTWLAGLTVGVNFR